MAEEGHTLAPDVPVLPPEHWANQPVDNDADSVISSELQTSTASITSSILKYRTLHGRTFHSEQGNASYWGANDLRQCESLDMLHQSFFLILGEKLQLAPVDKPDKVLDIGTGTGIWAIDFAEEHPESTVIGTDVSPIQPPWVPPNVEFEIEDFNSPWTFSPGSFNYIFSRYLVGSVTDWTALFKEAYKALAPGGYLESHESSASFKSDDNSIKHDSPFAQWGPLFVQGGIKTGRTFRIYEENTQVKAMEAAGFVDIVVKNIKVPFGSWPLDPKQKEIGELYMISVLNDIEGFVTFLANILGWTREQIAVFAAFLRRDSRDPDIHPHFWQRVVYGRKPEKE